MDLSLEFFLDISGEPEKNTNIGLVSFSKNSKDRFIDELFETYPEYEEKKGAQLKKDDHLNIIKFLNERKVRMTVLNFNKNDWKYYKNLYGNPHDYKVKMCSVLYFSLIKTIAWRNKRYSIVSCVESQVGNIEKVFVNCIKLANLYGLKFDLYYSSGEYNRGVKIADYIAYSYKLLKDKEINKIEYYKVHDKKIPQRILRKIFKKI